MGIEVSAQHTYSFGRLFLDYMAPNAPTGVVVYVQRDANGHAVPGTEIEVQASTEQLVEITGGLPVAELPMDANVVIKCDAFVAKYGTLPGTITSVSGQPVAAPSPAPSPAPAPTESPAPTEDAPAAPAQPSA